MGIPEYPSDIARLRVLNNIARRPSPAVFRERELKARFSLPSRSRQMQLAGMLNVTDALECMIALDAGDAAPESGRDTIFRKLPDGAAEEFDIIDVQSLDGDGCFTLTLSKI